jgi:MFS family permease
MQAGRLVARFGAGRVLAFGLALLAAGMALFSRISVGGDYVSDFLLPSLLVSTGIGLSIVPSTIAATATAAPGEAGLASGLVNTSRQMGGALGLAILTSLAVLYTDHLRSADFSAPILALNDGYRLAFILGAGFAATGAIVAFRFIPATVRPPGPAPAAPGGQAGAEPEPRPSPAPQEAAAGSSSPSRERQEVRIVTPARSGAAAAGPTPPTAAGEGPRARADTPPREGAAEPPGDRARRPPRPAARVSLSLAGGGGWAMAPGSMTVAGATDENDGRAS